MPRFTKIAAPADQEDPDIANAMASKEPLRVPSPDDIKGRIREEDIADLAKRDQKTILTLSVMEQWIDWLVSVVVDQDNSIRQLDAENARRKIDLVKVREQQKEESLKWSIIKWGTVTIAASMIAALIRVVVEKYF